MKYRRNLGLYVLLVLIVAFCFGGCQSGNSNIIDHEFTYDHNGNVMDFDSPLTRGEAFSSQICVIDPDHPNIGDAHMVMAQTALLINRNSGECLYAKSPFVRMYPASTTKILSALIALEEGDRELALSVGEEVLIDEENISLCDFRVGDEISFDIAINGMMLQSGNDAAAYLTRFVTDDMDTFIEMMNERARELGATKSNFVNAHGLHDTKHYSTAYDLYLIFNEAVQNKDFREIIRRKNYQDSFIRTTIYNTYSIPVDFKNKGLYINGEREVPEGAIVLGGKSGTTQDYQYNYCLLFSVGNVEYIAIVMGEESADIEYNDLDTLIEYAVANTDDSAWDENDTQEETDIVIPEETTTEYQYSDQG